MNTWRIEHGDALTRLRELPAGSVQCCVTSPPYWGLRDYGVSGQIGLEPTPAEYVARMVAVFADVRRVLADDGVLWLNLGDSYCSQGGSHDYREDNQPGVGASRVWRNGSGRADGVVDERGQRNRNGNTVVGLKPKDLVGIPWRVAFALQSDGWYLRSDVIWSKPNPMPESVQDRPTKAHEYVFLLTKQERYFYDAAAIRESNTQDMQRRALAGHTRGAAGKLDASRQDALTLRGPQSMAILADGRNCRSVWTINTDPYPGAHFAVMPEALATRCILSGSRPGDTILDPFAGAGTTGVAALGNGRNFLGIELNAAYVALARARLGNVSPLFSAEASA